MDSLSPAEHDVLKRKLTWTGPAPSDGRFLTVFMDQNNKCNLKCRMCGFSDARVDALAKYDMPGPLFDRIVEEVFPRTNYVCLSIMTEPFMTRDFPDRLVRVRDAGVPFSDIITNATLLTERSIEKVIDARISRLTISLDGGTKRVFESIRTGARFETVIGNLRTFLAVRHWRGRAIPRLRVNHVLSELNIDHFGEFLSLMDEIHPEEIAVRTVSRMSEAVIQESRDETFWRKVRQIREEMGVFCRRTGIEDAGYLRDRPSRIDLFDEAGREMVCQVPWNTLAIHPNGDVYPCMAWSRPPIGNLLRESFDDIWNGEPLNAIRREFETNRPGVDCLNCRIRRGEDDPGDDFFYEKLAATIE